MWHLTPQLHHFGSNLESICRFEQMQNMFPKPHFLNCSWAVGKAHLLLKYTPQKARASRAALTKSAGAPLAPSKNTAKEEADFNESKILDGPNCELFSEKFQNAAPPLLPHTIRKNVQFRIH